MLLLFPRRGKHSRDAIDFLIIFTIEIPPVEFLDKNLDDNRDIIYKNLIDFVTYFHYHARKGRLTEEILLILLIYFQLIIQLLLIILIQLNLMK